MKDIERIEMDIPMIVVDLGMLCGWTKRRSNTYKFIEVIKDTYNRTMTSLRTIEGKISAILNSRCTPGQLLVFTYLPLSRELTRHVMWLHGVCYPQMHQLN